MGALPGPTETAVGRRARGAHDRILKASGPKGLQAFEPFRLTNYLGMKLSYDCRAVKCKKGLGKGISCDASSRACTGH